APSKPGAPGKKSRGQISRKNPGSQGSRGSRVRRSDEGRNRAAFGHQAARSRGGQAGHSSQRRRPHQIAAVAPDRGCERENAGQVAGGKSQEPKNRRTKRKRSYWFFGILVLGSFPPLPFDQFRIEHRPLDAGSL